MEKQGRGSCPGATINGVVPGQPQAIKRLSAQVMKDRLLVLNLEDSQNDSELIEAQLANEGLDCAFVRVENRADFVQALNSTGFDLILADYSLPAFDGVSALEIAQEKQPEVPFIFISGAIGEEYAVEMLKNGATDYILKDRMSRLGPAVRRALQAAREHAERRDAEEKLRKYRRHLEQLVEERTAALYASEKRYRLLFENANDAIFIMDAEEENAGQIIDANDMAAKMHGYTRDELLKLNISDIDYPADEKLIKKRRHLILEGLWLTADVRHHRKDGSIFPLEVSAGLFEQDGHRYIFAIERDITERKNAEEKIRASLLEKEMLLKELYHRTKNNMQVISGLLNLQSASFGDHGLQQAFKETQDRIMAMSLVHERLYKSQDLSNLDMKDYLQDLSRSLMESYKDKAAAVSLNLEVGSIPLSIDLATPCGLIINELLSNSLKYAFPCGRKGDVRIAMQKKGEGIELVFSDNGVGLPGWLDIKDIKDVKTLGLRLVSKLVSVQLNGKLEVCRESGTRFSISFRQ